jgi:hypothetical protein
MKLSSAVLVVVVASVARADDPAMQVMQIMTRCPAISADGKHVALFSVAPGEDRRSKTSLAVFGIKGKLEKRLPFVPPDVDVEQASYDASKAVKFLDAGKYRRMALMASKGGTTDGAAYSIDLSSEDVAFTLKVVDRKVTITGTRGEKKLAPVNLTLPKDDGMCVTTDSFSVANTMAGYDKKSKVFAFEVAVTSKDTQCFGHDFVVTLK